MASPAIGRPAVLDFLADGNWHSGVALGEALSLSRAAIWKQVRTLRTLGLTVTADRGRGYRLGVPLDLLHESRIRRVLAPATLAALDSLEILTVTNSTNECLLAYPASAPGRFRVVLAEYQTGGRGRRGRRWLSPLGHGICMSMSWSFENAPRDLPVLSLVAGVAIIQALVVLGVEGIQLKWPNDVVAAGGKVGGILVEVSGEPGGPLRAVIGIGLNVRPLSGISAALDQEGGALPAVALDDVHVGPRLDRNALVATLLNALRSSLQGFGDGGSREFLEYWRQHDCLAGRLVSVTLGQDSFAGVARGIADDGSLLVEKDGRVVPVVAGDVTLRAPG